MENHSELDMSGSFVSSHFNSLFVTIFLIKVSLQWRSWNWFSHEGLDHFIESTLFSIFREETAVDYNSHMFLVFVGTWEYTNLIEKWVENISSVKSILIAVTYKKVHQDFECLFLTETVTLATTEFNVAVPLQSLWEFWAVRSYSSWHTFWTDIISMISGTFGNVFWPWQFLDGLLISKELNGLLNSSLSFLGFVDKILSPLYNVLFKELCLIFHEVPNHASWITPYLCQQFENLFV